MIFLKMQREKKKMNSVQMVGRVTRDIDLQKTATGGYSFCSFFIAMRRDKDNSDFIKCEAWNKTAELLSMYVKKGNRVYINGRLQSKTYEKDNQKKYEMVVIVDKVEFIETKQKEEQQKPEPKKDEHYVDQDLWQNNNEFSITTDDLPF